MLEAQSFPSLYWGELYFEKTNNEVNEFYTFPFSDYLENDDSICPLELSCDTIEKQYTPIPCDRNFSHFLSFLNYDIDSLNEKLTSLYFAILNDTHTRNKLLDDVSSELKALHPFFSYNTSYHICDILLDYATDDFSRKGLLSRQNLTYIQILYEKICHFVLNGVNSDQLEEATSTFLSIYLPLLIRTDILHYPQRPLPLNFITQLRKFATSMPSSVFQSKNYEWQQYLLYLENSLSCLKRVAPFSLTNHACLQYKNTYAYVSDNSLLKFYSDTDEYIDYTAYENIKNKNLVGHNYDIFKCLKNSLSSLIDTSCIESKNTYIIESFKDYFFSELSCILDSKNTIIFCPKCVRYHLKADTPCTSDFSDYNRQISERYNQIIKSGRKSYTDKCYECSSIENVADVHSKHTTPEKVTVNQLVYAWHNFYDYQTEIYISALKHKLSIEEYEKRSSDHNFSYYEKEILAPDDNPTYPPVKYQSMLK